MNVGVAFMLFVCLIIFTAAYIYAVKQEKKCREENDGRDTIVYDAIKHYYQKEENSKVEG